MSVQLITKAFETDVDPTARFVLVALADQVNNKAIENGCWPSLRTLQARTGYSERTIQAALGRLAYQGHITIRRRKGTSSRYHVHPNPSREKCGGVSRCVNEPGKKQTPARAAPPLRDSCMTTPAATAPKPETTKKETGRQATHRGSEALLVGKILSRSSSSIIRATVESVSK